MVFYENGKTYDVTKDKIVDTRENDIKKVGNKYVFFLHDKRHDRYHVFFKANTLKEAVSIPIPYEDKDYIEITLFNNYINMYGHSKNVFKRPETRDIQIGEKCSFGNIHNCTVLGKNDVSYYLKIEKENGKLSYDVVHWFYVVKENTNDFFENPKKNIFYKNTTISDLLHKLFYFGCDMNPDYQRGNVWTKEQEEKLIDSIFKQINIGSFIFAEREWNNGCDVIGDMYEIVDGKQRLTAILHFIEGKIKYNGMYYHEMHNYNRSFFEDTQIMVGEISFRNGYNKKEVLENFIRLNECGSTMNNDIIKNAKELMEEM